MKNKNIQPVKRSIAREGKFNLELLWEELLDSCSWIVSEDGTAKLFVNFDSSSVTLSWCDDDVVSDPTDTINAVLDAHDPEGKSNNQQVLIYFENVIKPHVGKDARQLFDKNTLVGVTASMFFWIMGAIDPETYTILPLSEWGRSSMI